MALRSRIPQIIEELQPEMLAAVQTAADLVEARAKDLVPVDTGRLRNAIHVAYDIHRGELVGAAVVAGNNKAFYGHIVEHGGANTPPHPFLVPALEQSRQQIEEDVASVLRKVVE